MVKRELTISSNPGLMKDVKRSSFEHMEPPFYLAGDSSAWSHDDYQQHSHTWKPPNTDALL